MTGKKNIPTFRNSLYLWCNEFLGSSKQRFKYLKYAMTGLAIVLGTGICYGGYHLYRVYQEKIAQKHLFNDMQHYYQKDGGPTLSSLEQTFQDGATYYHNTSLGAYFRTFYAETLLRQNKQEQGLTVLSNAIESMPLNDPLKPLFLLKKYRVMIDSSDAQVRDKGLEGLVHSSNDEANICADAASYFLGDYYWAHNDHAEAQKIWQDMIDKYSFEKVMQSPWVSRAQARLKKVGPR